MLPHYWPFVRGIHCWPSQRAHRENSPVTQTTPEPTLLSLSGHSDPPFFLNPLMLPFDNQVWRMPNLLKISLDFESDFRNGFFGTLHIDLKVELNFYDHYQQSCQKMHLLLPPGSSMHDDTHIGWKLCSGAWKRGQGGHVGVFSLCQ